MGRIWILPVVVLVACKSGGTSFSDIPVVGGGSSKKKEAERARRVTDELLRSKVEEFCQNMNQVFDRAAIEMAETDPSMRREAIQLQINVLESVQAHRAMAESGMALVDLWTITIQVKDYLGAGLDGDRFGKGGPIIVEASNHLAEFAKDMARDLTPPDRFEGAWAQMEEFARKNPMGGGVRRWNRAHTTGSTGGANILGTLASPFNLTGGVERGAKDAAESVDRLTDMISDMPALTRLQTELLLYDVNQGEAAKALREDINRVSRSVERVSKAAESLPEEVRTQVTTAWKEIESSQSNLQKTLEEAKATVTEVNNAVKEANTTVESVDKALKSFTEAGKQWEPTARAFQDLLKDAKGPPDPPGTPPGPTITDYGNTLDKLSKSAVDLRTLIQEIRELTGSDVITKRLDDLDASVAKTAATTEDLVDHIAWRAVQLILVLIAGLLGYRFVSLRISAKRA